MSFSVSTINYNNTNDFAKTDKQSAKSTLCNNTQQQLTNEKLDQAIHYLTNKLPNITSEEVTEVFPNAINVVTQFINFVDQTVNDVRDKGIEKITNLIDNSPQTFADEALFSVVSEISQPLYDAIRKHLKDDDHRQAMDEARDRGIAAMQVVKDSFPKTKEELEDVVVLSAETVTNVAEMYQAVSTQDMPKLQTTFDTFVLQAEQFGNEIEDVMNVFKNTINDVETKLSFPINIVV